MSTYTPIATQTLTSSSSGITFSSLPQNYTDLRIICNVNAVAGTGDYRIALRFNSDTVTNYSVTTLFGTGTTASSFRETSRPYIDNAISIPENSSGEFGIANYDIMNYSNSSTYKTLLFRQNTVSTTPVNQGSAAAVGLWRNTAAITSVTIIPVTNNTFASGSTFTIYGVAAGNSSAKASGGNIVTTDGSYWYHAFTSSGTFIPSSALTADVMVVAGGAGGGGGGGGGGGAGGLLAFTSQSLSANVTQTCIIGAGGSRTGYYVTPAPLGNDSQFGSLTLVKGGGGGGWNNQVGSTGGSGGGGGGGYETTGGFAGGSATSGQGNAGGAGANGNAGGGTSAHGGGGGGKGAAGDAGNNGNGGIGSSAYSSWGLSTGTGQNSAGTVYYAGGGGGGATNQNGTRANGGLGGGGIGSNAGGSGSSNSAAGTPNTGGGGGGGPSSSGGNQDFGSAGGSGIIIVRYAV